MILSIKISNHADRAVGTNGKPNFSEGATIFQASLKVPSLTKIGKIEINKTTAAIKLALTAPKAPACAKTTKYTVIPLNRKKLINVVAICCQDLFWAWNQLLKIDTDSIKKDVHMAKIMYGWSVAAASLKNISKIGAPQRCRAPATTAPASKRNITMEPKYRDNFFGLSL